VRPPNSTGARALAEALLGQGWRRFAVVGGSGQVVTSRERTDAFIGAVRAGGGDVVDVVDTEFSRDGGYAAGDEVATLAGDAQGQLCVFAVADVIAIGLIARLRELGVEVPHDLRVAGFDDIPTLRDHVPALTTVRIPLDEMGRLAVTAAVAEHAQDVVEVGYDVVLRASTAGA
jgi:LacI family transcriptional regulator